MTWKHLLKRATQAHRTVDINNVGEVAKLNSLEKRVVLMEKAGAQNRQQIAGEMDANAYAAAAQSLDAKLQALTDPDFFPEPEIASDVVLTPLQQSLIERLDRLLDNF